MAFGGSAFGASSSATFGFNSQPSLFGSAPSNSFPQSNPLFSQPAAPSSNPWSSNPNPNPTIPPNGTRAVTYQISNIHDNPSSSEPGRYVSISAMEPFRPFSLEELRLADYMRGDKGGPPPNSSFPNAFGQSTSAFGSAPSAFGPTAANAFPSSSSTSAFGNPSNPFGAAPNPDPSAASPFGNPQPNNLFGSTPSNPSSAPFGASNSLFGANPSANPSTGMGFASATNSLFGSSAPSAFGASSAPAFGSTASNLFGSSAAFGASSAGFASSSAFGGTSAPSLFGAPSTGGLFGSAQTAGAGGFGTSSTGIGASGAFGASFGAASGGQTAQSLFGSTSFGAGFGGAASGGAGLFGNTGAAGFGSTGGGLFGSTAGGLFGSTGGGLFGASSGGSLFGGAAQGGFGGGFGSSFGGGFGLNPNQNAAQQQQQQQTQGPLQASLTNNPFGDSKLFAGMPPNSQSAGQNGLGASVVNVGTGAGQSQQKALAVVVNPTSEVQKRTRSSELMARQTVMRRNNSGAGWFSASPMRPWGENGPVFDMNAAFGSYEANKGGSRIARGTIDSVTPWRTDEQRTTAANLKKLVIEPMADDPILQGGKSWLTMAPGSLQDGSSAPAGTGADGEQDFVTPAGQRRDIPAATHPFASNGRTVGGTVGEVTQTQKTPPTQTTSDENGEKPADHENMMPLNKEAEEEDRPDKTPQRTMTTKSASTPHTASSASGAARLEKFTPYSDFYRNQISASRGRTSLGSGERRMSRNRSVHAPISTDPEYYMSPSIEELSEMTSEELSHVDEFTIGRKGKGEVRWLEPVDLRRVNFDEVVRIENREVSVYPKEEGMAPPGQGLNKPAKVKLFGLHKLDKRTREPLTDASTAANMVEKLKGHSAAIGVTFLGYDVKTGTWTFQVDSF